MSYFPQKQSQLWQPWKCSGAVAVAADVNIKTTPGVIGGVILVAAAVDCSAILKNGATVIAALLIDSALEGLASRSLNFGEAGLQCDTSIKITVAGVGAVAYVFYK